jgi:peptidoglycan/LPS O-acetylase OafA/YrhL
MTGNRDVRIDVLRGIAALGVLLLHILHAWYLGVGTDLPAELRLRQTEHWLGIATIPLSFGFLGVNLFFLLSGFCIHAWYLGEKDKSRELHYGSYLTRRFWRIYPAYVAAIVFSLACLAVAEYLRSALHGAPEVSAIASNALEKTLRYLVFAHTLKFETFGGYNPPLYTMAIEVHFYLLYPVVLLLFRRIGPTRTLIASILLSMLATAYAKLDGSEEVSRLVMDSALVRWPEWIAGCFLVERWRRAAPGPDHSRQMLRLGGLAMICLAMALYLQVRLHLTLNVLWTGGLALLLPLYLHRMSTPTSRLENWLAGVGLFSYSLYLIHWPILRIAAILMPVSADRLGLHLAIYVLIAAMILLLARWFYAKFEKPFMAPRFRPAHVPNHR